MKKENIGHIGHIGQHSSKQQPTANTSDRKVMSLGVTIVNELTQCYSLVRVILTDILGINALLATYIRVFFGESRV
jgi:hypothetical protein